VFELVETEWRCLIVDIFPWAVGENLFIDLVAEFGGQCEEWRGLQCFFHSVSGIVGMV
jgi:hypothetical protein